MFKPQVRTGCKDCGHTIYHAPLHNEWVANMAEKYNNEHVKILYHYESRHYLTIIKGTVQKVFMSCAQSIEQLMGEKEVGRVLAWANTGED